MALPLRAGSTRLRLLAIVVGAATIAGSAGCGQSETPPAERAEATVTVLVDACERRRSLVALETLTASKEKEFVAADSVEAACAELFPGILGEPGEPERPEEGGEELGLAATRPMADLLADAEVGEVSVDGGLATATVAVAELSTELELELGPGGWLISGAAD